VHKFNGERTAIASKARAKSRHGEILAGRSADKKVN
jgi:hypothetical protein